MSHNDFDPHDPCNAHHEYGHSSRSIHDCGEHFPEYKGEAFPNELNFGELALNEISATQTITLTNKGSQELPVVAITAVGPYSLSTNCPEGRSLGVGGTCSINVVYRPTQEGTQTGGVSINLGDIAGEEFVGLLGSGSGTGPIFPVVWDDIIDKPYGSNTVPGIFKVGANLQVDANGVLSSTGGGGGGSGSPSGVAGGDLGGSYPNPSLSAARIAEFAGKANQNHTHSLTALTKSGAADLQFPQWREALQQWIPTSISGGGSDGRPTVRIAVIGDSMAAQQVLLSPAWPQLFEDDLRGSGIEAIVHNLALNGATAYLANTEARFGAGVSQVAKTILVGPNIVFVSLGFNETVMAVGGRSLAQAKADFDTLFQTLRNGLPGATLIYLSEVCYDNTHGNPNSTLLNKHVMPALMDRASSGILAGSMCSEILGNAVSFTMKQRHADWLSLDAHIRTISQVNATVNMPMWKAARLGLTGYDGLHLTAEGSLLLAAAVRESCRTTPALSAALPGLSDQNYGSFNDPETLFNSLVFSTGSDYATRTNPTNVGAHPVHQHGPWPGCMPSSWFLPSKGGWRANRTTFPSNAQFTWEMAGCRPNSLIEVSTNGGPFASTGVYTDPRGGWSDSAMLTYPIGTHVFRYRVVDEVFGPTTITITPGSVLPPNPGSWKPKVISGANIVGGQQTINNAMGREFIRFNGDNIVTNDSNRLSFTAAGNESRINLVTAGKQCFVRLSITLLVNGTQGANTMWMLGTEVIGGMNVNVQLDAKYSPSLNYALVLTGQFVGRFGTDVSFVPWVLTSAGGGTIASAAPNGTGSFWALEIISED